MSATAERTLVVVGAAVMMLAGCGGQPAGDPTGVVPTGTAPVVRTDIVSSRQLTGTLTYDGDYTVVNELPGIYTAVPVPGAIVSRGQALYRVNGRPSVLLYGAIPAWRPLTIGAVGPDVRQLELNLIALGFASGSNAHFGWADAAAVQRFQRAIGEPPTGVLGLGDVVFEPGAMRIATAPGGLGQFAEPGAPALTATSLRHVVSLQLGVDQRALVKAGDPVTVTLPDASTAGGTVAAIGAVATIPPAGPNGAPPIPSVTVTVALADPNAGGRLEQAPVTVNIASAKHDRVLAVPVMALLAQPGGTYAVEVVDDSQRRLVAVSLGLFDDRGLVEVRSPDLHEGMLVEVPVA